MYIKLTTTLCTCIPTYYSRYKCSIFFVAGTPSEPECGFSRKVVDALKSIKQNFGAYNILEDQEVREGLKEYSEWPTYPQVALKYYFDSIIQL